MSQQQAKLTVRLIVLTSSTTGVSIHAIAPTHVKCDKCSNSLTGSEEWILEKYDVKITRDRGLAHAEHTW